MEILQKKRSFSKQRSLSIFLNRLPTHSIVAHLQLSNLFYLSLLQSQVLSLSNYLLLHLPQSLLLHNYFPFFQQHIEQSGFLSNCEDAVIQVVLFSHSSQTKEVMKTPSSILSSIYFLFLHCNSIKASSLINVSEITDAVSHSDNTSRNHSPLQPQEINVGYNPFITLVSK